MPNKVQDCFGYALFLAQEGGKADSAKVLKGFGSAGVLELAENLAGSTYRAVYTVRFKEAIYVLHVFQKKSKRKIATPKHEINLIKERLRQAEEDYNNTTGM